MITLYYGTSSKPSRQAITWFENSEIEVNIKKIEQISRRDLVQILALSDNGFPDLLKRATGRRIHIIEVMNCIDNMSFDIAIDYLLENIDILKVPIVFDEHKLLVGFNTESIRVFMTKEHRKGQRFLKKDNSYIFSDTKHPS